MNTFREKIERGEPISLARLEMAELVETKGPNAIDWYRAIRDLLSEAIDEMVCTMTKSGQVVNEYFSLGWEPQPNGEETRVSIIFARHQYQEWFRGWEMKLIIPPFTVYKFGPLNPTDWENTQVWPDLPSLCFTLPWVWPEEDELVAILRSMGAERLEPSEAVQLAVVEGGAA